MDASENSTSNPRISKGVRVISEIIEARYSRRDCLVNAGAAATFTLAGCAEAVAPASDAVSGGGEIGGSHAGDFAFQEITRGQDEFHHIPEGYRLDLLLRWGDPVFEDSPVFDIANLNAADQERQFGYNCDFIGYWPLSETRGILCVNHEYVSSHLVFAGLTEGRSRSKAECELEMAAHGGTIIEIEKGADQLWRTVLASPYNRRITATTRMDISGPAAGSPRMQTVDDPVGRTVLGTINNCAGGITPWGTYLMSEENFNGNFAGELDEGHPEAENHARYGVPGGWYEWGRYFDRFNVSASPNEPNRFGWMVEVDILDPQSTPKKRTALGRFKHEGAESVVAPDGRVVLYMGDDQRFDYTYKFVTARAFDPNDRSANMDMLDDGTLYVARFDDDGTVHWLALTYGEGPLTSENGFNSQADVLIETRRAADLLGATPMDRPEDVEPDPATGKVYVMLTNNSRRTEDQVDAANPRADNRFGHIIEIVEPNGDFTATQSTWEIMVRCGDPSDPTTGSMWNPATSSDGWFGSPDNCAIDPLGRLWVATDGNEGTGASDGLWAMSTNGDARGAGRAFFRAPVGAEVCGPRFTPDGKTLFLAVQHPGDGRGANFENPSTRWPDFEDGVPPRPTVVVVQREDFGEIAV